MHRVSAAESDAYWVTRARGSQLGAWASEQSAPVAHRTALDAALAATGARFAGDVPRPPHWGGYRLDVHALELWQGRADRLHDRWRYERVAGSWRQVRLQP